jgi:hypothetical protein
MVGYFTVGADNQESRLDWDWLLDQPALERTQLTRLLRFDNHLTIKINGHQGKGIILKPEASRGR